MAAIFEQAIGMSIPMWECKECHRLIGDKETVAYHLVERVLYGWCESCFDQRARED